jgi:GNAT superfamily N-acetyltransferase
MIEIVIRFGSRTGNDVMRANYIIQDATIDDAKEVATLVGELLGEIMTATGLQVFHFEQAETAARLRDFIEREKYFVFVARDPVGHAIGFISLCESHALYAEGAFGTIPELYVRPDRRSGSIGQHLLARAKAFATMRGWKRLEVATPPLPEFDRTLAFYEREGFAVTGGCKLKTLL